MDGRVEENGRGCHGGGDVSEWKKVAELRAVAEAQDPAAKVSAPSASSDCLCSPQLLAWLN
jgi:hypothetical protein